MTLDATVVYVFYFSGSLKWLPNTEVEVAKAIGTR
jgi:hypothetical protein